MVGKSLANKNLQSFIVFNFIADILAECLALKVMQLKYRT